MKLLLSYPLFAVLAIASVSFVPSVVAHRCCWPVDPDPGTGIGNYFGGDLSEENIKNVVVMKLTDVILAALGPYLPDPIVLPAIVPGAALPAVTVTRRKLEEDKTLHNKIVKEITIVPKGAKGAGDMHHRNLDLASDLAAARNDLCGLMQNSGCSVLTCGILVGPPACSDECDPRVCFGLGDVCEMLVDVAVKIALDERLLVRFIVEAIAPPLGIAVVTQAMIDDAYDQIDAAMGAFGDTVTLDITGKACPGSDSDCCVDFIFAQPD